MRLTIEGAIERLDGHEQSFSEPCHEATFVRLFRHGSMEIEFYRPRGEDLQTPHTRDEIYFIASGSGQLERDASIDNLGAGDVAFVAAGEHHRFVNFSSDFSTWVVFYGPDGGE